MAPIKRHPALQPLSKEHHHTLLLVWKIRSGLRKAIAPQRIRAYADWFFQYHLKKHFCTEESLLTEIMPPENELMQRMFLEHATITDLFADDPSITNLEVIAHALEQHVRFEERELFNEVQRIASEEQLQSYADHHHDEKFVDRLEDEFWK